MCLGFGTKLNLVMNIRFELKKKKKKKKKQCRLIINTRQPQKITYSGLLEENGQTIQNVNRLLNINLYESFPKLNNVSLKDGKKCDIIQSCIGLVDDANQNLNKLLRNRKKSLQI